MNNQTMPNLNNTEQSSLKARKKAPVWLFIIMGVLVIAIVAVVVVFVSRGIGGTSAQKKIAAAEKYLSELDYENAIAAYREAIEINPELLDAYVGLADVYIAMADDQVGKASKYEAKGETDKAQKAYEEAIEYYNEALDVLDDAIDNVSDSDRKRAEKKKRKVEGYIEEAEAARDNEIVEEDSNEVIIDEEDNAVSQYDEAVIAAEEEMLREALDYTIVENGNYSYVNGSELFNLLDALACGNGCGYMHSVNQVEELLSGNPDTYMNSFYIMGVNHGESFPEYIPPHAFWQPDYENFTRYASVADLEYDVFSITGKNVDLTVANDIEIVDYQGIQCFKSWQEAIGYEGEIYYIHDISDIEYNGDETWRVVASIYVENYGWGLQYNAKCCEAYFYMKPNSESYYGYNVIDYDQANLADTGYYEAYDNIIWNINFSNYYDPQLKVIGYCFVYINEDEIPEMVLEVQESTYMESMYIYTYKNGTVIPYDLRELNIGQADPLGSGVINGIFSTPGAMGIYNWASYIPYSGKIMVTESDSDYAGALHYSSQYYYDNNAWYLVRDSKEFMRDEDGNMWILQSDPWAVEQGIISTDEYDNVYSAPGYDPDAAWQGFEFINYGY